MLAMFVTSLFIDKKKKNSSSPERRRCKKEFERKHFYTTKGVFL